MARRTVRTAGGLFQHALLRELRNNGLAVFFVLAAIFLFTQMIRLLGESASGLLSQEGVWALVGYGALAYLPILLSISLFLSVLLTLSRSYRDSEMVVWFTAGVGLVRWIRPVLLFALPTVLAIALMSLLLSPWARMKSDELIDQLANRDDVSLATPGLFRESSQGERVFFLEQVDTVKQRVGNIFVQTLGEGRNATMVAAEGLQEFAPNGDRFLVLLNGKRYEGVPGAADYRILSFERYAMRIEPVEARQRPVNHKALSTAELLAQSSNWNRGELLWRIGQPVSGLLLALLAIPLSHVDPRAGRSYNLILAAVLYMFYNNLLGISMSLVGQGKIGMFAALGLVHGPVLLLLFALLYGRIHGWRWRQTR